MGLFINYRLVIIKLRQLSIIDCFMDQIQKETRLSLMLKLGGSSFLLSILIAFWGHQLFFLLGKEILLDRIRQIDYLNTVQLFL